MFRRIVTKPRSLPWHPGYPFKPRGGHARRVASGITLAALLSLIGGYYYVTDSERVRSLAQQYLTEVVGGPVQIGRARLSIFEGLRLEQVTIDVDDRGRPESRLLEGEALYVSFSIPSLLMGSLSDVSITAVGPRVLLVSDAAGQMWNFQRLGQRPATTRAAPENLPRNLSLPTVTLRNARIVYAEMKEGKLSERGTVAVEGTLKPVTGGETNSDRYGFTVTARGGSNRRGPSLTGTADLATGQVSAKLQNFDLGPDVESMLPGIVRDWWQRHEITGTFDIPELSVEPATATKPRSFRVRVRFDRGAAALDPDDLRGRPPVLGAAQSHPELPLVRFSNVRGELLFTDAGIELRQMSLEYGGNVLGVSGHLQGYTPDAPFNLQVECAKLSIQEMPSFIPSLPKEALEVWNRFKPSGEGTLEATIVRGGGSGGVGGGGSGGVVVSGKLKVHDGRMVFENFPLLAEGVSGEIVLSTEGPGRTKLEIRDLKGHGPRGTVNEQAKLTINGEMSPLEGGSRVDFTVTGEGLQADDALMAAMPEDARKTLGMFAADKQGPFQHYPEFAGSFVARVHRDEGRVSRWSWPIDVTVSRGRARFEGFPYPLENVTGKIRIESGLITLSEVAARRGELSTGDAVISVGGRVTYGEHSPERRPFYDLVLSASKLPVDEELVAAMPAEAQVWMKRLGVSGLLDAEGTAKGTEAEYDLGLKLTKGALRPAADDALSRDWTATDLSADLRVTKSKVTIERLSASRLQAPITASGSIECGEGGGWSMPGRIALDVTAKGLSLDAPLRGALSGEARAGWDAVNPVGSADVTLMMRPGRETRLDIAPLGLSVMPEILPLPLTDLHGLVSIEGTQVTLKDVSARRDDCVITLGGTGSTRPGGLWDLSMGAKNVTFDAALREALPGTLKETVNSLGVEGKADVEFRRLAFTGGSSPAGHALAGVGAGVAGAAVVGGVGEAVGGDCDFDVSVVPSALTVRLGVPVTVKSGEIRASGAIRQSRLADVKGTLKLQTGDIAGRPFSGITANLEKSPEVPGVRLDGLGGTLADGELAGQAAIAFPPGQPTRYAIDLVLRNADARTLGGPQAEAVSGRLSASLAVEGTVNDAGSRKGRGDIVVTGDRMARIPVLLGLVQVANLSLPGDTSFNNATARYVLDGPLVTFDQLALRSPGLEMVGNGRMDLEAREVKLTLWTAPPDLPKIPLWSDLADRARRELLQIQVRGKIDDPKIGASSFDSFSTTVDEVLKSTGRTHGTTRK